MPAITYNDFSGGLDRRLPINVQEASRLWSLTNAYITLGKRIRKRPCLNSVASGLTGSFGLEAISSRLKVFVDRGSSFVPPAEVDTLALDIPPWATGSLDRIHYADIFSGYSFVVARYTGGQLAHHYIDREPTVITVTIASPGVVTWANHGLVAGREIQFSTTAALPTGITAGTTYYVLAPTTNTFTISATSGGSAINTSGTQSGVHTGKAPTYITDTNNPRSLSVTKAASRIFAVDDEVVRYCAAGNPRDWTSSSDAGFLAASLQQDTKSGAVAVGTFQDALVVFFTEGAQIWDVAVDPTANAIRKRIAGVGVKDAPLSLASFANDLAFLSPFGVRSMTVASQTDRIDDTDIGVPIDTLVLPDVNITLALDDHQDIFGVWVHQLGQYWLVLDVGGYSKVWAYTYSKSSKIACWSEYTFPILIQAIATLDGRVYMRDEDSLYECSAEVFTDNGQLVPVEVQMAFQDAKTPGVLKQFYGGDYVVSGTPDISFKYDPRDTGKESTPQLIPGDTRPGEYMPVEICASSLAPVIRHSKDEAFEFSAMSLYFESLGLQR